MIARYIQGSYAKPAYAVESFDVRAWPGMAMVVDALQRGGHEVGYCSEATAHEQRIILVSITSACDWWSFIAERERWGRGSYTVIVGGPGCLNVRPFLRWFDVAVFGRSEDLICPLVDETLAGHRFAHPAVCYSDEFNPERTYQIQQAENPWPHSVRLESGKMWAEGSIGCQRKCKFCAYTWHRRNIGGAQSASGAGAAMWNRPSDEEITMFDLDMEHPECWPQMRIIGLDGMSERLRRAAAKPITREMLRGYFSGLATRTDTREIKIYNVVSYPGETEDDWLEFLSDLRSADSAAAPGKQYKIVLHCTPFRPMPATPAACWPMAFRDVRGKIAARLKSAHNPGQVFYQGNRFWVLESLGTDSLSTVALDAVALRGAEPDSANVARVARTRKFWAATGKDRLATLAACFDLPSLFGEFTGATLPTRYLRTYAHVEKTWP